MSVSLPQTREQSAAYVKLLIGVVVVVMAIILFKQFMNFGSGALEFFNLKDTKEEKENNALVDSTVDRESAKGNKSAWSPNFYKSAPYGTSFPVAADIESIAKQFWGSVGYMYDTPAQGMSALKRCASQAVLSKVSEKFAERYGLDLLSWLQKKYDTSTQKEILADMMRFASNLPKY